MNKYVILTVLAFAVAAPAAAQAQGTPPAAAQMAPAAPQEGVGFETQKAQMLKSIGDRIADLQKKQTCIQSASKPEDMKGCFPAMMRPPMGMQGQQGGPGMGQPPQPGMMPPGGMPKPEEHKAP